MRRPRHALLPADELQPSFVPAGENPAVRAGHMGRLRELSNAIADGYRERDELLLALAASQTLSRRDMATACGLAKSRVDQIIAELPAGPQGLVVEAIEVVAVCDPNERELVLARDPVPSDVTLVLGDIRSGERCGDHSFPSGGARGPRG